jgi:hypothetical protein
LFSVIAIFFPYFIFTCESQKCKRNDQNCQVTYNNKQDFLGKHYNVLDLSLYLYICVLVMIKGCSVTQISHIIVEIFVKLLKKLQLFD